MPYYMPWIDLSTDSRPSYALICREATGQEGQSIVKREGVYMTEANAKRFDEIDRKRTPFNFMGLPYELRHQILSYVCDSETTRVFLKGLYGPPTKVPLPAVACVHNRKLRAEAILATIEQTTLEIHSGPGNVKVQNWLSAIDFSDSGETSLRSGFDAVRVLRFPYFSRHPHASLPVIAPNNDIQLMLKCRNLRKVTLQFVHSELTLANTYHQEKSIYILRRQYRFDSMLKLFEYGKLQTIVLQGSAGLPYGYTALHSLASWMRGEYALRANLHAHLTDSEDKSMKMLEVLVK